MAFHLKSKSGDVLKVSGGHWAVFLTLAGTFGWKPAGTERPLGLPPSVEWSGRYDSSDGQFVTDADAQMLAQVLHAAAVSNKIQIALADVIAHVERQVAKTVHAIPAQMRMQPADFFDEFSPLLTFLYKGGFCIE
jgi:hypothetical protein